MYFTIMTLQRCKRPERFDSGSCEGRCLKLNGNGSATAAASFPKKYSVVRGLKGEPSYINHFIANKFKHRVRQVQSGDDR